MAMKVQGGRMVPVEDGHQRGMRMRSSIPDNYVVSWEGDRDTIMRYATKLKAQGYRVEIKQGFKDLMELDLYIGEVVRKALGPLGAIPLTNSRNFTGA